MYPEKLVAPMREELTANGFISLETPEAVISALNQKSTVLLVINSVCGCAAGIARPSVLQSLQQTPKPDYLYTVFAGVDTQAVETAREKTFPFPPSSPSVAIFKDGILVHMLERHHIEGNELLDVVENLQSAYAKYCK